MDLCIAVSNGGGPRSIRAKAWDMRHARCSASAKKLVIMRMRQSGARDNHDFAFVIDEVAYLTWSLTERRIGHDSHFLC
jgi:hypothetical protein